MKQRNPDATCGTCVYLYTQSWPDESVSLYCVWGPTWEFKTSDHQACAQHPDFFLHENPHCPGCGKVHTARSGCFVTGDPEPETGNRTMPYMRDPFEKDGQPRGIKEMANVDEA